MDYQRTEPLPQYEDRFERFYIRYDVNGDAEIKTAIRAEVWETCEWTPDGKPVFWNAGPRKDEGMDPTKSEPLCELLVKWDGCSHLRVRYLHFDELEEFDAFGRVVKYIYDEICDRHDVGD